MSHNSWPIGNKPDQNLQEEEKAMKKLVDMTRVCLFVFCLTISRKRREKRERERKKMCVCERERENVRKSVRGVTRRE